MRKTTRSRKIETETILVWSAIAAALFVLGLASSEFMGAIFKLSFGVLAAVK